MDWSNYDSCFLSFSSFSSSSFSSLHFEQPEQEQISHFGPCFPKPFLAAKTARIRMTLMTIMDAIIYFTFGAGRTMARKTMTSRIIVIAVQVPKVPKAMQRPT